MKKNFTDSVLKTIRAKKITPRERSYFIAKTVIQIAAGIAFFLFGMLSVALVFHLINNFAFAEFILNHPQLLRKLFWFGVPVFWVVLSVLLWFVIEQIVRETKRVYRMSFGVIGILVLSIQVLGGFILEQSQVGEQVDLIFEQRMNWYHGAQKINRRLERMPEHGFLVGEVLKVKSDSLIFLNDIMNKEWEVYLESKRRPPFEIKKGMKLRMIGEMRGENEFKAIDWKPARDRRPPLHKRRNSFKKDERGMRPPFHNRLE